MARYIIAFVPPHGLLGPHVGTVHRTVLHKEPCHFKISALHDPSALVVESLYREDVVAYMVREWAKSQQLQMLSLLKVIESQ